MKRPSRWAPNDVQRRELKSYQLNKTIIKVRVFFVAQFLERGREREREMKCEGVAECSSEEYTKCEVRT
jgi:hypothetical protein